MSCNDDKNTTESGEFIPTAFNWETLDSQKEKTKKLANITKDEKANNNKKAEKVQKKKK